MRLSSDLLPTSWPCGGRKRLSVWAAWPWTRAWSPGYPLGGRCRAPGLWFRLEVPRSRRRRTGRTPSWRSGRWWARWAWWPCWRCSWPTAWPRAGRPPTAASLRSLVYQNWCYTRMSTGQSVRIHRGERACTERERDANRHSRPLTTETDGAGQLGRILQPRAVAAPLAVRPTVRRSAPLATFSLNPASFTLRTQPKISIYYSN